MANYATLKGLIDQYITTNGQGDITGAILNDVLKNIVNSIEADYLFGGVVVPSSNVGTPDQNVFFIATQGGSYQHFNGTIIPNGITIFKWNGSWSYQILFAGDGGIFDISAYHNNTRYADLKAALGTNGANIPQTLRSGGMSIKFVQSSDNEYVHYLYKLTSTTDANITNLDNWEKINLERNLSQLSQKVVNNYWVGNGNTFAKTKITGLRPGATYRIFLRKIPWDMTGITVTGVTKLAIQNFYNGAQTTDLLQVGIAAELRPYYDFTIPENSDYINVGGRATSGAVIDWDIVDLTLIKQKADLVSYFAAMSVPTFLDVDLSTPTLKVKFPVNGMRLYDSFGASIIGDYMGARNQTFTLNNLQSLVWDFVSSSIKVVGTGTAGDYVHLLNLAKNSVTGLFAGWFNEQMRKENNPTIAAQKAANTLGEAISASKDFAITSGMSGFSAQIDIGVPYNRRFIIRVNDPDGTLNKVSDLAGYDYDGNNVVIAGVNLLPNTDYTYYAPKGLASLRIWVGASYMTGTAGTISVQVSIPSQYDDESIVRRWNDDEKLTIRNNMAKFSVFNALFFSDIHGNTVRFNRILELGNDWKSIINFIIDGGDDTAEYQSQGNLNWYNTAALTSEIPIIRAAGNHDAWTTNYGVWATPQELYEYFTAVAVAQLIAKGTSVFQPTDAASLYKNYYYVDFGAIRIIVLTSMSGSSYFDATQLQWFKDVLNNSSDKHVLCVNHCPFYRGENDKIKSNWSSYKWETLADTMHLDNDAILAVDTFIEGGGKFVGWLCGHTHIDCLINSRGTHKQLCFSTSCAKGGTLDGQQPTDKRSAGYDLLNMVSIDTTNFQLKVWRIGFDTNSAMQVHNTFVWDYAKQIILSES